jgi:hypothetical protein
VLGNARAGAVLSRFRERGHLYEVEVIEQPDPHHARRDMQPASDPELYEFDHVVRSSMHRKLDDVEEYDGQNEPANDRSPQRIERIFHVFPPPGYCDRECPALF